MLAEIKDEHFQKYITLIAREIQNLVNIHFYLGTKNKHSEVKVGWKQKSGEGI